MRQADHAGRVKPAAANNATPAAAQPGASPLATPAAPTASATNTHTCPNSVAAKATNQVRLRRAGRTENCAAASNNTVTASNTQLMRALRPDIQAASVYFSG
jgi:hypothetical protein